MSRRRAGELRRALREVRIPDELGAQERAWPVVHEAFATRLVVRRPRGRLRFVLVPAVLLLVAGALELTPAGAAVHHWIERTLSPPPTIRTKVVSLPAPGSLLVSSPGGTWVLSGSGGIRRLGAWTGASWSPRGLYAAVTSDDALAAVDPRGRIAWRTRAATPTAATWSTPSGYRIAYRSGRSLWVMTGDDLPLDGTGPVAWLLSDGVAPLAPAWRPGSADELIYATEAGAVVAVNAGTRRELWRFRATAAPRLLTFSADGRQLLVLTTRSATILDSHGRVVRNLAGSFTGGALSPDDDTLALVSEHAVLIVRPGGRPIPVFTALGGSLGQVVWSPDGSWLLTTWPSADEWVMVHAAGKPSDQIISNVSRRFGGSFPAIDGWCCTATGAAG